MNILLLGDSWAYSWPTISEPIDYSECDIEHALLGRGHFVVNKSYYGGSNTMTLSAGLNFIESSNFKPDLIVWLCTELCRDTKHYKIDDTNYYVMLDNIHQEVLKLVIKLKEKTKCKWAIIGGHAPIYNLEDYKWADFIIEDWRSEILGVKLSACHSLSFQQKLCDQKSIYGLDTVEAELKKYDEIVNAIKNAPAEAFPNGVHPHNKFGVELVDKILTSLSY